MLSPKYLSVFSLDSVIIWVQIGNYSEIWFNTNFKKVLLKMQMEIKNLEAKQKQNHTFLAIVATVIIIMNLIFITNVYNLNEEISSLQNEVAILQSSIEITTTTQDGSISTASNINSVSLVDLYDSVKNSVVTVECIIFDYRMPFSRKTTSEVQGSGFIYEYKGEMIIITNNHEVEDASNISVTFANGNTYNAEIIGTDVSSELAFLVADTPTSEYYPLEIVSSQTVNVGDYVIALGSPYGLEGTMTTGIVSALNRTITVSSSAGGSFDISGLIQTSAPINSGNSGGPLITYNGQVIGITTAILNNSDGLGFVVSSDTILSAIENILI
jgi:S1-C subfamily serine protease